MEEGLKNENASLRARLAQDLSWNPNIVPTTEVTATVVESRVTSADSKEGAEGEEDATSDGGLEVRI